MKAVSIIGPKNSGKTTLGLQLARCLKDRGLTVSAAKFSHHGLDWQDTDTAKYAAICDTVAGLGPGEAFVHWTRARFLPDLLPLLTADVLLVEGGKSMGYLPRVLCLNGDLADGTDWLLPELAIGSWGDKRVEGVSAFTDIDALADMVLERGFFLPGMDCGTCGRPDCRTLAADIVRGATTTKACLAMHNSIAVDINGAALGMKPFVEEIISASIREMLRTLKGYAPGKATIRLDV
ncbi:MAG: molybdopterin-guanine dinucleotide biosynthesis protein MobB [Pseudodesulfovibrio sp.]|uniref:Fe-S cluster domain protein n=1 Tax=Pseudodesulfovibrio aespoeensis (strain ATCC 700646 / DSM 10631 / Aspo-2) TaxID=643562 RepID=E6VV90_PSEA9|nr:MULTISPECIES: molybdopterin-guanine dinucleotide biosynthesis protein MobB [Pseudodesulfovibrio]MBU4191645.1 molybdopterin-guanine dinucleotide biosynthesis protein MobB [Pseudomonadota bacterium]MCG2734102.1 molybdopterin-guanine dinucleotide biosynthesis protein MobB [Pseudodesulfovibrio aespoeensis]ADU62334.1 Fe-S cluster domain protein [Pseudodesulfovibrio aespoeensis Aspo-2]MBU4243736.1 molybdopterin-guanine dinucleotide biosynthesis protein MobB [Pseudomonadota bacterium]MBU4379922.1 